MKARYLRERDDLDDRSSLIDGKVYEVVEAEYDDVDEEYIYWIRDESTIGTIEDGVYDDVPTDYPAAYFEIVEG